MIAEIIPVKSLQLKEVCFYTVKIESCDKSEFKDFVTRLGSDSEISVEYGELINFLLNVGERGAEARFFKSEGFAEKIRQPFSDPFDPLKPDPKNYGIRLYCYRLTGKIVILFNGCRKRYAKAQDCKNCSKYFEQANVLAKAVELARHEKRIVCQDFDILPAHVELEIDHPFN